MSSINNIIKKLRENRILTERKDYESYETVELVDMSQRGDQLAIETLIKRHGDQIKMMANKYFLGTGDKDDILQIATIGFWEAIMSWDKSGKFEAYAGMVMKRRITDELRKEEAGKSQINQLAQSIDDTINSDGEGGEQTLGDTIPDKGDSPEELAQAQELMQAIETYLVDTFTADEREVIRKSVEGLKTKEIAEVLGMPYKKVDNILYKIKYKLKEYLKKESFIESKKMDKDIEFSDEEKKILESALNNIKIREDRQRKSAPLKESYDNYTTEQIEDELDKMTTELKTIERSMSYYSRDHIQEDLDDIIFKATAIFELGLEESEVSDDQSNRAFELTKEAERIFQEYDHKYTPREEYHV